jgi:hypothetical protein
VIAMLKMILLAIVTAMAAPAMAQDDPDETAAFFLEHPDKLAEICETFGARGNAGLTAVCTMATVQRLCKSEAEGARTNREWLAIYDACMQRMHGPTQTALDACGLVARQLAPRSPTDRAAIFDACLERSDPEK